MRFLYLGFDTKTNRDFIRVFRLQVPLCCSLKCACNLPGRRRMICTEHTVPLCRLFVEYSHIFCVLDVCLGDAHCLSSGRVLGVRLISCWEGMIYAGNAAVGVAVGGGSTCDAVWFEKGFVRFSFSFLGGVRAPFFWLIVFVCPSICIHPSVLSIYLSVRPSSSSGLPRHLWPFLVTALSLISSRFQTPFSFVFFPSL